MLGYICVEHGYQRECDVNESGQRICRECEQAVTGLTGSTRGRKAPPSERPMHQTGKIRWLATGYDLNLAVDAFDHIAAVEAATERVDDPQEIKEIKPQNERYRRH